MQRCLLLALTALIAPGCLCEPSRKGAEALCRASSAGDRVEFAHERAISAGLTVHDFPDAGGFLASERAFLPSDAKTCQVNAREGRITSVDLFSD